LFKVSEKVKLKALTSLSTSYITPSGYQLYSASGNIDLKPESYFNLEFGGSIYINNKFIFNAVYFDRTETNVIDYASTFDSEGNWTGGQYINLDSERKVTGVELDVTYNLSNKLTFSANYSHAEAEDPTTFYRIPNDKYGTRLEYALSKNTSFNAKYNYTGSRTVFDYGSFSELELESYGLFDIYAQHIIYKDRLTTYGAVNNVFDTEFVGLFGYTTKGINYNIGLKYNF
jgi:vitamin B12 transporter